MRFSVWICYIFVAFIYVKCQDQEGCICDSQGTLNFLNCTNKTLVCDCASGYSGEFCQQCEQGFFRLNSSQACQPCGCHANGAINKTCDSNGVCSCRGNSTGDKCDDCVDGYFNLNDTCEQCQCNGHSRMCNKTTGVCIHCQDSSTGDHCESCLPGYYKVNSLCILCNGSSPSSLCIDTTIQPVTEKTIPVSHDANSPITQSLGTSVFETTKTVNSSLQTTLSSSGTPYPNTASRAPYTNTASRAPYTHSAKTVVASAEPLTNHSINTAPPPSSGSSSKGSLPVILGVVLTLIVILIIIAGLLVYHYWVKPRRRFFRSPLWTIELRRDEDDTLFNDLQTIDPDVLYLDDAYLMDSARVYNKVTTENSRYHPLG